MFDRFVTAQDRRSPIKQVLIFGSVIIHAVAVVALIIYSFVHVEEVEPPPLTVTFVSAPPPPPPPPPPKGGKPKQNKPKTVKPPIVQPKTVQPLIQPPDEKPPEPEEEESDDEGVEGGVPGGVPGGVLGGVLGGVKETIVKEAPPPPPPPPKNIPAHHLDAQVVSKTDPSLPDNVKIQFKGTTQIFMAKVCVDQGGKVFRVDVLQGIPNANEGIVSTIRQWRYKPQAIPVCFMARWEFTIE